MGWVEMQNNQTLEGSPASSFDWREAWYPVAFVEDIPKKQSYSVDIFNEPYLLVWANNKWFCLQDRCPHRGAKLSDGAFEDGQLECLYHGWKFDLSGHCVEIPQLEESTTIPRTACLKSFEVQDSQGILWVYLGTRDNASQLHPPMVSDLDDSSVTVIDTQTDLPYDQNLLVENLLDPAHVYISHDRTELNIKKENARPLEMEIIEMNARGFQGRFRAQNVPNAPWTSIDFIAPNLVLYQFTNKNSGVIGGLALHALPTRPGQSRILVRRYANFFKVWFKYKPRWIEHLRQNKILEEDLEFIVAQQDWLAQTQDSIQESYLPMKTVDSFVLAHRKWLDEYGQNLPWYQGYKTHKVYPDSVVHQSLMNRYERHTAHCSSCLQVYQVSQVVLPLSILGMLVATLACFEAPEQLRFLSLGCLLFFGLLAGVSLQVKNLLTQSYSRRSS